MVPVLVATTEPFIPPPALRVRVVAERKEKKNETPLIIQTYYYSLLYSTLAFFRRRFDYRTGSARYSIYVTLRTVCIRDILK